MSAHQIVGRAALRASRVNPVHLWTSRLHERRALVLVAAALLLHRPRAKQPTNEASSCDARNARARPPPQREVAPGAAIAIVTVKRPCHTYLVDPTEAARFPSRIAFSVVLWGHPAPVTPLSLSVCRVTELKDPSWFICCESNLLPPCPTKQSPLPALSSTWGDIRRAMAPIR